MYIYRYGVWRICGGFTHVGNPFTQLEACAALNIQLYHIKRAHIRRARRWTTFGKWFPVEGLHTAQNFEPEKLPPTNIPITCSSCAGRLCFAAVVQDQQLIMADKYPNATTLTQTSLHSSSNHSQMPVCKKLVSYKVDPHADDST